MAPDRGLRKNHTSGMRRLLLLAALLLGSTVRAALPDTLAAMVAELRGRAAGYEAGRVGHDPDLEPRMGALKAELERITAVLPETYSRKPHIARLAAESGSLTRRWMRPGTRYGQIGRELNAFLDSIEALDRPAGQTVPGPVPPLTMPGRRVGPQLQRSGGRALAVLDGATLSDAFAMRDAPAGVPAGVARPVTPPRADVTARPDSPPPLRVGSSGDRVTQSQNELNHVRRALGLRVIGTDGDYGPQTRAAVAAFQRSRGLPETGVIDEATELDLFRASSSARDRGFVQLGDDGQAVADAQDMLNRIAGYRLVAQDGDFGGGTQRAVRAFQRANGLEPHGHVDERTLNLLRAQSAGKAAVPETRGRSAALAPPGPVPDLHTSRRMPPDIAALIADAEREFGIAPHVFRALVWAEGGAIGNSSVARGPAQITQSGSWDCRQLGYKWRQIRDEKRPNIRCGAYIFAHRPRDQGLPEGASPLVAASLYNTVARHWPRIVRDNKVPPFAETTSYVTRISRMYCQYTGVRLLDPHRDLYPRMMNLSKRVDRDMVDELALEGRQARPGCSPY